MKTGIPIIRMIKVNIEAKSIPTLYLQSNSSIYLKLKKV